MWKAGAPYVPFQWQVTTMPERAVVQASPAARASLALMGNSVVPDAVRYAFLWLLVSCRQKQGPAKRLHTLSMPRHARLQPAVQVNQQHTKISTSSISIKWPRCGLLHAGTMHMVSACHCPPPLRTPPKLQLVFDPSAFKPARPPSPLMQLPALTSPVLAKRWATPRHGCTHVVNYITARTLRDLPTQVRFERSTPDQLRAGGVNPAFSEWMMGYPIGWTRAAV